MHSSREQHTTSSAGDGLAPSRVILQNLSFSNLKQLQPAVAVPMEVVAALRRRAHEDDANLLETAATRAKPGCSRAARLAATARGLRGPRGRRCLRRVRPARRSPAANAGARVPPRRARLERFARLARASTRSRRPGLDPRLGL